VTHPFHPLHGREFTLLAHRHSGGEDGAVFIEDRGPLVSLLAQLTGLAPPDPFVIVAVVGSAVRVADLLEQACLLERLRRAGGPTGRRRESRCGPGVPGILPPLSGRFCQKRVCALRSDDTDARKATVARFGRSDEWR
jgi:hypothetical protein